VAPFVFKITPLHGPQGKHRLPLFSMHIYSSLPGNRLPTAPYDVRRESHRKHFIFYCCLYSCIQSCCLETRRSNPLHYNPIYKDHHRAFFLLLVEGTFRYLRTTITDRNLIQEKIKRRLNSGNAFYHSVQNLLYNFACGSVWV
jgi:hypothetical protein